MQMTMDQAFRPGLLAFALKRSSGYVMRSEKRPGYGGSSGGRGRKPKKPKAGLFYIIMTIIISVLLWPIGMVMLWRKKVRMQAGTKLLISLLTMCLCVFLIVFALTVHVDNEKYTAFQDQANDWLNETSAKLAVAGDAAYQQGLETWGVMTEFADNAAQPVMNTVADGMDRAVALACTVRSKVQGVPVEEIVPEELSHLVETSEDESGESDVLPDTTSIRPRIPENSPAPENAKPLSAGLLTAENEIRPDETPEPTPTPAPTPEPEPTEEVISWSAMDENGEPENASEAAADAAADAEGDDEEAPLASAEVEAVGDADATDAPEETPEPTAVPQMTVRVKPAAEARVYYNPTGRLYHMASTCKNMSGATAHTLAEAVVAGKLHCNECGTPDESIIQEPNVVWVDKNNLYHTSDGCAKFVGEWTLISLDDAVNGEYTACPDCEADLYTALYAAGSDDVAADAVEEEEPEAEAVDEAAADAADGEPAAADEASDETAEPDATADADQAEPEAAAEATPAAEPTATEEPTPSPEPTPQVVTPAVPLKAVGDVTVYHSSNGKFYHRHEICKGMTGSSPYKLSEITSAYRRCRTCDAPDMELVGQTCLWMDENGLCHTSDECAKFQGEYTLILRDEALEQGKTGCPDCGAGEYLVPGTVLAEAER